MCVWRWSGAGEPQRGVERAGAPIGVDGSMDSDARGVACGDESWDGYKVPYARTGTAIQSCNPDHPLCIPHPIHRRAPTRAEHATRAIFPQLAESSARFLRPHLIPLVDAMMRVAGAGDSLEPETRRSAVEFLVSLCEAREHTPGKRARVATGRDWLPLRTLLGCAELV